MPYPDSGQRIKTLEEQVKKLQQGVRELEQKLPTHDHQPIDAQTVPIYLVLATT